MKQRTFNYQISNCSSASLSSYSSSHSSLQFTASNNTKAAGEQKQEHIDTSMMLQKQVYLMNKTAGTNKKIPGVGRKISERSGELRTGSQMNPSSYKESSQVNYTRSS